ncbi:MAG: energy transducer TonB [Acidobacteria bacterium]|nr:energy transducer TonB [Acidobacteriota bacterium]
MRFKIATRKLSFSLFFLFCCFLSLAFFQTSSISQTKEEKQEPLGKQNLYKENVKYEDFACNKDGADVVKTFFASRPLNIKLPICHNDCPIIKCRPVVRFPLAAQTARVTGKVSVHVLVDEKGKVIYARVLDGHPLLWAAARKGACETQFEEYQYGKHQGVMHFTVDDYEFLGVPNRANEFW